MPPSVENAPDLSGLIELSRVAHLDLKPVVLRVQTDLFVQAERRDRAERESFEALACGLIPTVDEETALIVAEKLAAFPGTPEAVLAALAHRGGAVRDAVVAGVPTLSPRLLDAALGDGADLAGAIAARPGLDRATIEDLIGRDDPAIDRALAANTGIVLQASAAARLVARGRTQPDLGRQLLARPDLSAAEMAPLYLHADPLRREAIRESVEATAALRPCPPPPRGAGTELTGLSAAHDVTGFIGSLAGLLGLPRDFLSASPDPGTRYDLITLCLRAADLHEEEAVYVFLTLNEGVARSAERVFDLVRLFRTVSRAAARDLISAITDRPLRERGGPAEAYQPHHAPESPKVRAAASERPALRPALPGRVRMSS
ncbi:hypothetical protein BHAOGJBA_5809 [Methylobacterium hispanicum]|jgi:hypothetical protein|uniref:DUF2336 domain-containing protein n=2 Tax=Methylobacterium TaxID=407 RepID=A0AAV4ZUK3_9HYPH|nr:DUF2336 domain-containing protein [Methylobacterium hispanicum]GJD92256.1 hypothetical protein BHAOGJBA_5809 [Methylobacterium hispanicum]